MSPPEASKQATAQDIARQAGALVTLAREAGLTELARALAVARAIAAVHANSDAGNEPCEPKG